VQVDRQDKSAVGWDHVEKLEKHESQIGKVTFTTKLLFCIHAFKNLCFFFLVCIQYWCQ
jgi:hypothetical protein